MQLSLVVTMSSLINYCLLGSDYIYNYHYETPVPAKNLRSNYSVSAALIYTSFSAKNIKFQNKLNEDCESWNFCFNFSCISKWLCVDAVSHDVKNRVLTLQ